MIFKSRQVNLDPEPWESVNHGKRGATALVYDDMKYRPRPEFEPTRDPWPYVNPMDGSRWYAEDGVCWPESGPDAGLIHEWSNVLKWAPRREQFDTPVNRVLVAFRRDVERYGLLAALDYNWPANFADAAPDEIDHARRVLTRLANWQVTS